MPGAPAPLRRMDTRALEAAMADANVPTLLMVLVHLTGDLRWLEAPYRPTRTRGLDDNATGGLSVQRQNEVRAAAVAAVQAWADGEPIRLTTPDPQLLGRMMTTSVGEPVPAEYGHLLAEEMAAEQAAEHAAEPPAPPEPTDDFTVAVIGAGVSGIMAAVRLRQAGIRFEVFERADDVGGTWLYNGYPGAGVDTPSYLYSYSFQPWDWSTHFGRRDEVLAYLRHTCDRFDLRPRIRLGTSVESATYAADRGQWTVRLRTAGGVSTRRFDAVVSAVGQLNVPNRPDLPGLDEFAGPVFHSSEWPADLDVTGRRVAVVGTGASAMQIVPAIAPTALQVTVFQRSPHWIAPSASYFEAVPPGVHWLIANVPFYHRWYRFRLGWTFNDKVHASLQIDPRWPHPERALNAVNDKHREYFTHYLRDRLAGREDLQEKALPSYPPFGKRMLLDNGWFEAIRRPNVALVTGSATRFTATGVHDDAGREHEADVVVLATGFQARHFLQTLEVRGRSGRALRDVWGDDDARAYLGITVPDFPNLFLLYGPGTSAGSGGSYISIGECQITYVVGLIAALRARGARVAEVRREAHDRYNDRLDEAHARMVWTHPGVSNYYRNAAGRVVTNSPWRFIDYWRLTRRPDLADYAIETDAPARASAPADPVENGRHGHGADPRRRELAPRPVPAVDRVEHADQ